MLILTRKEEESLIIDGKIEITIIKSEDGKVKLGITAPKEIEIHRKEIFEKIQEENKEAKAKKDAFKNLEKIFKKD
jgi:carbon storage regulator